MSLESDNDEMPEMKTFSQAKTETKTSTKITNRIKSKINEKKKKKIPQAVQLKS